MRLRSQSSRAQHKRTVSQWVCKVSSSVRYQSLLWSIPLTSPRHAMHQKTRTPPPAKSTAHSHMQKDIILEVDSKRDDEIAMLKAEWESASPGRREKGMVRFTCRPTSVREGGVAVFLLY
jgi:hypothetical protein